MNKMLEKLGLKDGESIDHPWINKALERAQEKVESRNFDIRKTLLKFDNVLNDQRQVIFGQRSEIIPNKYIYNYSNKFLDDLIEDLLKDKQKLLSSTNENNFENKIKSIFGKSFDEIEQKKIIASNDKEFSDLILQKFKQKREERIKMLGNDNAEEIEKRIFLQVIDSNWKSHIQYLEQLRQVIGLRSYGQRDPLVEYKKEAFNLFSNLLEKLKLDLITILINLTVVEKNNNEKNNKKNVNKISKKIKRNEKCYCGSGKKFKFCHGAL